MSPSTTAAEIAVIGDGFMKPEVFEDEIRRALPEADLSVRRLTQAWPDEPMVHGWQNALPELAELKEFMGTPDEVVDFVGDASVLVTHLAPVSGPMLERLPKLKFVGVSRGGPVNIDMKAAKARGVTVVNAPGRNASAVAEFTLGAILAETRLITRGHEGLRAGAFRGDLYRFDRTGEELSALTVGVVGYGHIGTRVVKLLKAFEAKVLVCDPYVQLSAEDHRDGVEQVELETLLGRADVVTLHPRVTEETAGMIGRAAFAAMKDGAIFVNTARGPLVDYDALYDALTSGKLRGAMLETFGVEPTPPDLPLLQLPNVTLTPHIAGASVATVRRAARMVAEDLRNHLEGRPLARPC